MFTLESLLPVTGQAVSFPFHLRVREWCKNEVVKINGAVHQQKKGGTIAVINREWKSGDVVELQLPMHVFKTIWYENSVAVERGPITYALKITEEWKKVNNEKDRIEFGDTYYEIFPKSAWNYGLIETPAEKLEEAFKVEMKGPVAVYPWNPENAPVEIKTKAKRIPSWRIYNEMSGPIP